MHVRTCKSQNGNISCMRNKWKLKMTMKSVGALCVCLCIDRQTRRMNGWSHACMSNRSLPPFLPPLPPSRIFNSTEFFYPRIQMKVTLVLSNQIENKTLEVSNTIHTHHYTIQKLYVSCTIILINIQTK